VATTTCASWRPLLLLRPKHVDGVRNGSKQFRREGRYLLRTNLCAREPAELWRFYIQLVEIEAAFKNLKDDLQLRPIYHQLEERVEAHIFVAFIAYCLHVTLRARLKPLAPGLTPRAVLDKLAAIQMLDLHFPTTDGRTLILSRYTELNVEQKLLAKPTQTRSAVPASAAHHRAGARRDPAGLVETLGGLPFILFTFFHQLVKLG